MKLNLLLVFVILTNLQNGKCKSLQAVIYRIIGAEGEASLTVGQAHTSQLAKVSMTFWNGTTTPAQEWRVEADTEGQHPTVTFVNSAVADNVLSYKELQGNFRVWKLVELAKGVTQIKDAENGKCLTRLGVTVYDEGTLCDTQAQSQQWKFLPNSELQ